MPAAGGPVEPFRASRSTRTTWWSPDGRRILSGAEQMTGNGPTTRLYSSARDGGNALRIARIRGRNTPLLMALSPDRRQVAYGVLGAGGRIDLIIRRVAGGPLRRVNNARTSGFASWGPRP